MRGGGMGGGGRGRRWAGRRGQQIYFCTAGRGLGKGARTAPAPPAEGSTSRGKSWISSSHLHSPLRGLRVPRPQAASQVGTEQQPLSARVLTRRAGREYGLQAPA